MKADFIELVNDCFDLMNSINPNETEDLKKSFGLNFSCQIKILEDMKDAILNLVVSIGKSLYPFQRGFLISMKPMEETMMSQDSMRIGYIFTQA